MRLLIAQGPQHRGVNIRLIDEATYERLLAKTEYRWTSDNPHEGDFENVKGTASNGTTLVMTRDINGLSDEESEGFDSGWWLKAEAAIEEALK